MESWERCRNYGSTSMTLTDLLPLIDLGGTGIFALMVWWELRGMRRESLSLLQRLAGYIEGKSNE